MSEDIKQAVQHIFEKAWNQGDTSAADQVFADSHVAHIADIHSPINNADEFKQSVALFRALSPGIFLPLKIRSLKAIGLLPDGASDIKPAVVGRQLNLPTRVPL